MPSSLSRLEIDKILEKRLKDIIAKLVQNELIVSEANGLGISSTPLGDTMSRNCIDLETMTLICKSLTT